ncbi:hypothetical protein [Streptomyces sp. NPDC002994]
MRLHRERLDRVTRIAGGYSTGPPVLAPSEACAEMTRAIAKLAGLYRTA